MPPYSTSTSTADSAQQAGAVIEEFVPLRKGASLRGFARVRTPAGLIFHDVAIHRAPENGNTWASPSSKVMLDRQGTPMRDDTGRLRYAPVIGFASKALRDRFSDAVIQALRRTHPEAFDDTTGRAA